MLASWWTTNWLWVINVSLQQRQQKASWAALEGVLLAGGVRWSFFSVQHWQDTSGEPSLVLGSPVWETWTYWSKSKERPPRWLREYLAYKNRLREMELFRWEKRRFRVDLIPGYTYQIEGNEEEWVKLFSLAPTDRTRNQQAQNWKMNLHLNKLKHLFVVRNVVESPFVKIFKTQLDIFLDKLL